MIFMLTVMQEGGDGMGKSDVVQSLIDESLLWMRVADISKTLYGMSSKEFDKLRKDPEYGKRAYEHYLSGKSIIHFDAAMFMKYMIEAVNRDSAKMQKLYKLDREDDCYFIVRKHLEECIDIALNTQLRDAGCYADYRYIVKSIMSGYYQMTDAQSRELWVKAKQNSTSTSDNYSDLANAVVLLAVRDYESALSGFAPTKMGDEPEDIINKVKLFAANNSGKFSGVDLEAILTRISRNYKNYFVPLVKDNCREILAEWKRLEKGSEKLYLKVENGKYHCPSCGNILRRGVWSPYRIECCGCNLSAPMPDDVIAELQEQKRQEKKGKRNASS